MVFLVPWLCPEAWYARFCVKLQDMDRKGVAGDRFCVSEEQNYFYLNVNKSIKYLHGRHQYLMGQGCISERGGTFQHCREENFSFPTLFCLP